MNGIKKPNIKAFGKGAIHSRCDAFKDDAFVIPHCWEDATKENGIRVQWEGGQEFYPHYSCKHELPEIIEYEGGYMQGTYNFVNDSKAELFLACSYFAEMGWEYYVFFSHSIHKSEKYGEQDHYDWCIWTPNTKHFNKRKKEVV